MAARPGTQPPSAVPARHALRGPHRGRRGRRLAAAAAGSLALLLAAAAAGGLWLVGRTRASLPVLAGRRPLPGLTAPVTIERDSLGVPTLRGANRLDLARALGFLHAQERFFEMDLTLRRRAAGEVAELAGPAGLPWDRRWRVQRFRELARRRLAELPPAQRAVVEAYSEGVNAGLAALAAKPFEYLALRAEPAPWRPEDTLLAIFAMYVELQSFNAEREANLGLMRATLPPRLVDFLLPAGTSWDTPLLGGELASPPPPGPEVYDLRRLPRPAVRVAGRGFASRGEELAGLLDPRAANGSHGWAVAGSKTAGGGALLANDLHLPLRVPNLWYRAELVWPAADGSGRWNQVTGITLPGVPVLVAGSNTHVAWGLTNGMIDGSDLILLDLDPKDRNAYLTPAGPAPFTTYREVVHVAGGADETVAARWTRWGPVVGQDAATGKPLALHWVAHEPEAVDLGILELETATGVDQALAAAHRSGVPAQNFLVADEAGRIAWSILGRIPRRRGFDGSLPASWSDGARSWQGLLSPDEVPQVVDPPAGRLWSANNRAVNGEMLAKLGDGGYRLGAAARQIRDRLLAMPAATPRDMLDLQLDDRALLLARWQELLLRVLTPQAVAADPRRAELRRLVSHWEGRAAVESVSYRLVRAFRRTLAPPVFAAITAPCRRVKADFDYLPFANYFEGPLWRLVTEQPPNLLDPRYRSWQERLLATVDEVLELYRQTGEPLAAQSWGRLNTVGIHHLLSGRIPGSRRWLDMPDEPLPGDDDMPRVQRPEFGATMRMVVSPGREREGFFEMPAGESGNPWSPHYGDSQRAWAHGEPRPFLPGPPVTTLTLTPAERRPAS
jgi:penicillin amidase